MALHPSARLHRSARLSAWQRQALAVDTGSALHGPARWAHIALAMGALATSWLLLQTQFALHYARVYHAHDGDPERIARGLAFPGGADPDCLDYPCFSAVVGMSSQVSDVAVTSRRQRRLTLVHGALSFAFKLVVLALAINGVAGSLGKPGA